MLARADETAVELALEAWAIWERWETDFKAGRVSLDTHPALPGQNARMSEIDEALEERRKDLTWSICAQIVESKHPGPDGAVASVLWKTLEMPSPDKLKEIGNSRPYFRSEG